MHNQLTRTLLICCMCAAVNAADVYRDMGTGVEYTLPDLLFPSRPAPAMRRMYPHVIPFADMLDPSKRHYQFGFPESLRGGVMQGVSSEVVFYVRSGASASGSSSGTPGPDTTIDDWLRQRKGGDVDALPVRLRFEELMNPDVHLTDLMKKLGGGKSMRTSDSDITTEYLYADHIREFLIGTWSSMAADNFFHIEEKLWSKFTPLWCFAASDVSCYWRRFLLVIMSSKINIRGSTSLRLPTIDEDMYSLADTFAVSFWFAYCSRINKILGGKGASDSVYCPNPCRNRPCVDMAYTITDSCEVLNGGLYELDFKCTCTETASWSSSRRACVIYDRCKMNSPCSLAGTESCEFNSMVNKVRCHCKADYMGHDCSQLRDACYVRQTTKYGSKPTGNRACNVESGNQCIPVNGTNLFSCRCGSGWLSDNSWGSSIHSIGRCESLAECGMDPNCQRRRDPCMSLPCETGDCVSGMDEALCQCPVTHFGRHCQHRRGLWSAWGPWSSCDPDCGDRRVRHRSRGCLGVQCLGHGHESAWCDGLVDCGVPERLGIYPTSRWRTATVLRQLLVAVAVGAGVSMGALFACQCCLLLVLKSDRGLLNSVVTERVHSDQLLVYRRLSYKTAMELD